jgi:signal peptidase I
MSSMAILRRLAVLSLLVTGLGMLLKPWFPRYVVEGRSMLRAYAPGDRLIAERLTYKRRRPRPGDAVVVRQPGAGSRPDLKRIAAVPGSRVTVRGEDHVLGPDEWFVIGDNLDESADSRQLGPVSSRDIVGRVWFRY